MVTHGESKTKLHKVWRNMRDRCVNPNNSRFSHYGERGISACEAWDDYTVFRDWALAAGYREGLSLDRIDNDGDYSPDNCRWATYHEQNNNFSRNRIIEYGGEVRSISVWARIAGIHRNTLDYRLRMGWSVEEALFTKATLSNRSPETKARNFPDIVHLGDAFGARDWED